MQRLDRLVGDWTTEATHPAMPGVVVHGTAKVEWLEGERFLIHRARTDHADFPDSISILGSTDQDRAGKDGKAAESSHLTMHYFDSRGVSRVYDASVEAEWRWWRTAPGFSQRFVGTFKDGGDTIVGVSQVCEDDVQWKDDLAITYRRVKRAG